MAIETTTVAGLGAVARGHHPGAGIESGRFTACPCRT